MERLLFLDIDTQKDFINTDGALYVEGAEQLKPNLKQLMKCAKTCNIYTISSTDAHLENDPEFKMFPPHCVRNTEGQKKIPETVIENAQVVPDEEHENLTLNSKHFVVEKTVFDVFSNSNTDKILNIIQPDHVVVFGVATDYCVKAAVMALVDRKFKVSIVSDAIKGIKQEQSEDFLRHAESLNVEIVMTNEVLQNLQCLSR
jgi:nicotinamidase/pyrazinamidase